MKNAVELMQRIQYVVLIFVLTNICLIMAGLLPAHAGEKEPEPLILGAVFSETGIAALHNRPLIEMIEVAVDWVNSEGGVLGRPLELRLYDNNSTPIGTMEAAHRAVADQVTAVLGAHWSSHSLAMAPVLQQAKIPMISPASTHPDVTKGRDYIFRISFIDSIQGAAMAQFAVRSLHARQAAILRNIDEQYSNTLAEYFRKEFTDLGGEVVYDHGYRGEATDFSSVADKLAELQPEVIFIPGYTRDTALAMKQLRQNGVKGTFLGGDGWDRLEYIIPEQVDGSYQSAQWHPDAPYKKGAVVQKMYEQFLDKEIRNMTTPLAYDAVMVLVTAIRKAGSTDPEKIKESLAAMEGYTGATGSITFDDNGDPIEKDVIIVEYREGEKLFHSIVHP